MEIGGYFIKEGDMVLVFVVFVNCDEMKFDRVYLFDIYCYFNLYIVFGYGIYFCFGVLFVCFEVKIVLMFLILVFFYMECVSIILIENSVIYGLKSFCVNI